MKTIVKVTVFLALAASALSCAKELEEGQKGGFGSDFLQVNL